MGGSQVKLSWEILLGGSHGRLSRKLSWEAVRCGFHELSWKARMGGSHGRLRLSGKLSCEALIGGSHGWLVCEAFMGD